MKGFLFQLVKWYCKISCRRNSSPQVGVVLNDINNLIIYVKAMPHVSEISWFWYFSVGFIFNIQELQYEDSLLRQFCNPILERDNMIKSSAYKKN